MAGYLGAKQSATQIDGYTKEAADAQFVDNDELAAAIASVDVTAQVQAIVDAAPEQLNTLNELAAALNDDANFGSTVTNAITSLDNGLTAEATARINGDNALQADVDAKMPLTGGTFTGNVGVTGNLTTNGNVKIYNDVGGDAWLRLQKTASTEEWGFSPDWAEPEQNALTLFDYAKGNWTQKWHENGDIQFNPNGKLSVNGYGSYAPDHAKGIAFGNAGIAPWNFNPGGSGQYMGLTLYATGWNGSAVETRDALTINGYDSNVGIHTTNPTSSFHVAGNKLDYNGTEKGIHMGMHAGAYAGVEMVSDAGQSGWIDFRDINGGDYSERIRAGLGQFDFYVKSESSPSVSFLENELRVNSGTVQMNFPSNANSIHNAVKTHTFRVSAGNGGNTSWFMRVRRGWWGDGNFRIKLRNDYYSGSEDTEFQIQGHSSTQYTGQMSVQKMYGDVDTSRIAVSARVDDGGINGTTGYCDIGINVPSYYGYIVTLEICGSTHTTDINNIPRDGYTLINGYGGY